MELLKAAQEKEQQASLAVEEAELQKSAVQAEGEARAKELQLELESVRTVSQSNNLPAEVRCFTCDYFNQVCK